MIGIIRRGTGYRSSWKEETIESNSTYLALSEVGVDYNDSWKSVLQGYPQFPPDAEYHRLHTRVAGPQYVWQSKKWAGSSGQRRPIQIRAGRGLCRSNG